LTPEQLSYRSVLLTFNRDTEDARCARRPDRSNDYSREARQACHVDGSTQTFMANLRKAGWIKYHRKSFTYFVRQGVPVQVIVKQSDRTASLEPITLEEVDQALSRETDALVHQQQLQRNSDAVLHQLSTME
jgi:UDP-3-O-acyl-N-acetylglucosamine deacetylase